MSFFIAFYFPLFNSVYRVCKSTQKFEIQKAVVKSFAKLTLLSSIIQNVSPVHQVIFFILRYDFLKKVRFHF